jgi:hypothetical protein
MILQPFFFFFLREDTMMSNRIGHEIAGNLIEMGIAAGSGALAALVVSSPIGASGGALGATLGWLAGKPVQYIVLRVFNGEPSTTSTVSRISQFTVAFFATAGAFLLTSSLLSPVPLSFKASCILTVATIGIEAGLILVASVIITIFTKTAEV